VDDVEAVHVGDPPEELIRILLDAVGGNRPLFHNLQQILLNELTHKINLALLAEDFLELDDVVVAEGLEYFDLPKDDPFVLFVGVAFLELFNGD
jgi:hypothetical protein